jgi:2-polyprenyl-3-methyl-5-hydroxy-6-metoxy-1,4-benzoquinol methylase
VIETKMKCDNEDLYGHRYSKKELQMAEAIAAGWWQIETNSATLLISQPVSLEQVRATAKHACSAECARAIIKQWSEESIQEKVEEAKNAEDIPY